MNKKRLISVIAVIVGVAAVIVATTFATKVFAVDWHGKIGDTRTIQLDPSECKGSGGSSSTECYKILTCAPAAPKCECDSESDWH